MELLGEGGLLKQMTKAILERSMAVELTDHLDDEQGDPSGAGSGNSRNGPTRKRSWTRPGTWTWRSRATATPRSRRRRSATDNAA